MYCINFPTMFTSSKTLLSEDKEAIKTSLKLLLQSDRMSLLGDPYYGCLLRRAVFEQNDIILIDLVIDEIYTTILTFLPQVHLTRNDIKIVQKNDKIFVEINCIYILDRTSNMYEIELTDTLSE